jgi:hypothetical protein
MEDRSHKTPYIFVNIWNGIRLLADKYLCVAIAYIAENAELEVAVRKPSFVISTF